ncbi:MAG: invasion associated locus B family protein [Shimia sp.]
MTMKATILTAAACAAFTATAVVAQEGGGLDTGDTVVNGRTVGSEYIKTTFQDWNIACVVLEEAEACSMQQTLTDSEGNPVAEMQLVPVLAEGPAIAGADVTTPLGTDLRSGIVITVDDGAARRFPFATCVQIGCIAQFGLTEGDIASMKRGAQAIMRILPVGQPQPVELPMSLSGFTAAYDSLAPQPVGDQ